MYERKFIIVQLWLTYKTSRNRLSPWLWKKLSQFMFWNLINIRKHVRDQSHVVNSQSLAQFFQIVESLKLSQIALQSLSLITASWPKKSLTKTNYATYSCIFNTQFLHLLFSSTAYKDELPSLNLNVSHEAFKNTRE